ncbi:MAG: hypothetical protein K6B72_05600 [Lachnospiraceae bacterium]|nr:hypothetical protein [Lachnospiraceae bacterium]
MLRIEEARAKTFEERMTDVYAEIPLYSSEWTNFNPSDPGITILENLTAFEALQADSIMNVPAIARRKLLALAGFSPAKGKCARVLLKALGLTQPVQLPANARFFLGGMVYETNRAIELNGVMRGVFTQAGEEWRDVSFLTDREVPVAAPVFGDKPCEGNAMYFIADHLPEPGRELIFYMTMEGDGRRNPVEDRAENVFAAVTWECYTAGGFTEMKTRDYTGCFLSGGEIRLRMPDEEAQVYDQAPVEGYCIRAVLKRAAYDIPPRIIAIESFLFEVWQRDTRAACITVNKSDRVVVRHPLAADEQILVFAKEEKGSSYRRYMLSYSGDDSYRCCKYTMGQPDETGRQRSFTLQFGMMKDTPKPDGRLKDPVRVVLYSEEVMRQYQVGKVMGYDDQEFELPMKHVVAESFCLIARREDENGDYLYDFVRPEKKGENNLYYHLLENDGRILIEEAGDFIGAELFIGSIAVTEGEKGNVRAMGTFKPQHPLPVKRFFNPGPGTGGSFRETLAQVGVRLRQDIDTPYTAVTARDYERLVMETPGLCISKAHAVIDEVENLVRIAVLPGTGEEYPVLSEIYRREILRRLEERRLVSTRVEVLTPRYARIHVRGTVYVKRHYDNPGEVIEKTLRDTFDYVHSERSFGEPLHFRQIFSMLEALPCVAFVYELSVMPDDSSLALVRDADIFPGPDVLCTAGEIAIETVSYEK